MMKSSAAAGALLLVLLLTACSHTRPNPATTLAAAAAAREHAAQQARAVAAALDEDRQQLDSIPLPSKNVYLGIRTRQSWTNPFLIVGKSSVNLSILYPDFHSGSMPGDVLLRPVAARRRVLDLRLSDLPEALTALPENTWPFGRVIAVEEDPLESRQDGVQVRRNVEATMQQLNDLGVVVYEWPTPATR